MGPVTFEPLQPVPTSGPWIEAAFWLMQLSFEEPGVHCDAGPKLAKTACGQAPPAQTPGTPQALPHEPQFDGSLVTSRQTPPQSVSPGGHVQTPPLQTFGPGERGHTLLQLPQLFGSVWTFVQTPSQSFSPAAQTMHSTSEPSHWPDCP
jgi:hypothetical protein